jgi:hypothetical protein
MTTNVTRAAPLKTAHVTTFINPSASGATAIIAAIPGAAIRVLGVGIVSTLANSVKFQSNSTDISATWPLGANGGIVLPFNEHGWCQTAIGEALNINMTVATATGIHISYIIVLNTQG